MQKSNKRKVVDFDDSESNAPLKLRRSERIRKKNAKPCNLCDLNDDCILEILSYLPETELSTLNGSCCLLEKLTEDFVRRKYKCKWFRLKRSATSHDFMRVFGKNLTRLMIDFRDLDQTEHAESFLLVNFTNLLELYVVDLNFSASLVDRAITLCQNLKNLSIASCATRIENDDLRKFMRACTKLESLNVYARLKKSISTQFLAHHYPAMRKISIRKYYHTTVDYQQVHIQEFLEKNPHIESVTFDFKQTRINSTIFMDISKYSVNIKSIQIRLTEFTGSFVADVAQLHRLNNLIELNINCEGRRIGAAIDALATTDILEILGLSFTTFDDEMVSALCKLTKLKTLILFKIHGINQNTVQNISNGQRSLVNLHFVREVPGDFCDLVSFVEYSPKLKSVTYTTRKFSYWNDPLFREGHFKQIANARKSINASNPLTFFMNTFNFKKSMVEIPKNVLHEGMCYLELMEDANLSYPTQMD